MANIALDAHTNGGTAVATSITFSHTVTGSFPILFVGIYVSSASDLVTGITYNAVAMTRIPSGFIAIPSTAEAIYLYYLVGPTTGANNVVATISGGAQTLFANATSYTGARQATTQIDASDNGTSSASTTVTKSITTTINDDWLVGVGRGNAGSATAGANTTLRGANIAQMCDSNGVRAFGANSLTLTYPSGGNAIIVAAFKDLLEVLETMTPVDLYTVTTASSPISVAETMTPVDTSGVEYGFGNRTKNSSTWTNRTKL